MNQGQSEKSSSQINPDRHFSDVMAETAFSRAEY